MQFIDHQLLDRLTAAARENRRLRMNHNLHAVYDEPCQRLLNAVEPGSYIRPHRHLTPPKPETFLVLRGRFAVLVFHDDGGLDQVSLLSGDPGGTVGVDIPAGAWHCIISLESGSVFFETKPGPYEPLSDKDWAPWAPAEAGTEAAAYLESLRRKVL